MALASPLASLHKESRAKAKRHFQPRPIFFGTLVFLVVLAVFSPNILHGFWASDDFGMLSTIKNGGPLSLWCSKGSPFFRPLVSIVFWTEFKLFGANPQAFILVKVCLLAATAIAVGLLGKQIALIRGHTPIYSERIRWIATIVFLLWPTHAETVDWVVGLTDELSGFFCVLAIYALIKCLVATRRVSLWMTACLLFSGLAFFSKESAIVLPLLCLCIGNLITRDIRSKRLWTATALVGILILGLVVLRREVIGEWIGGYGAKTHLRFGPEQVGINLVVHFMNDYFPFNRQLSQLLHLGVNGLAGSKIFFVVIAFGLCILHYWPRSKGGGDIDRRLLIATTMAGSWLLWLITDRFLYSNVNASQVSGSWLALFYIVVGLLAVRFILRKQDRIKGKQWLFWFFLLLVLGIIFCGVAPLDFVPDWFYTPAILKTIPQILILLFALSVAWTAFVTRPVTRANSILNNDNFKIGLTLAAIGVLTLLPVVNLSATWNGEQSRYDYLGSVFSVLAIIFCATALKDRLALGRLTWQALRLGCFLAFGTALLTNNLNWLTAEAYCQRLYEAMKTLPTSNHPSRIYVVSVVGDIDEAAFAMNNGINPIPTDLNRADEAEGAVEVVNFHPGEKIEVKDVSTDDRHLKFDLTIFGTEQWPRSPSYFIMAGDSYNERWFDVLGPPKSSVEVILKDFHDGDHILWDNGSQVVTYR